MSNKIKPIAIYLPQFHPVPENDQWWGKGFTEWTNVTKATPRFEGHYQPHLPADLGFYDLRLEESRLAQEKMAKDYGIYGFCYYHYWFNGKKILDEPIKRKLENPKENFPFMLCWANENWTRAWDGLDKEVLLYQDYNDSDDIEHMKYLCQTYFTDSRYIRHDGKPVFMVYRPHLFKDIKKTIKVWRNAAKQNGIGELHIGYMQSWGVNDDPGDLGFDFAAEFQPNLGYIPEIKKSIVARIINKVRKKLKIKAVIRETKPKDKVCEYEDFVNKQKMTTYKNNVSPCITPMWDNSSRRKKDAIIFNNSTPEIYGSWLQHIIKKYPWHQNAEKYLFINAWNEWAEGNHLEPCQKWGKSYLEMTKSVLKIDENEK